MKRNSKKLIFIASTILLIGAVEKKSFSAFDPAIHKICLDAKDYIGCVNYLRSPNEKESKKSTYMSSECRSIRRQLLGNDYGEGSLVPPLKKKHSTYKNHKYCFEREEE